VIGPDQSVELRKLSPEHLAVVLLVHERHGLGDRQERSFAIGQVVVREPLDEAVPPGGSEPLVGISIVDLPVQHVSPVEHLLGTPGEFRVARLDRLFGDGEPGWSAQEVAGQIVELVSFQAPTDVGRVVQERLVEHRVPIVEGIEQPSRRVVPLEELPVERAGIVEPLIALLLGRERRHGKQRGNRKQ
jgi:hypothetical protein